ncbi:MAG: type II toxin-antitoxin system VapC family toxin [Synechococcaceae cyanobacterium SM1_2_3]|nr:type II toxin-antitoxin system VapC family toxin [Synechococcaceae cyanobacterium SM1_2_3]
MIILDTNVISESLRPRCRDAVTAWLDAQAAESLYLTAINAAELWAGVAVMPEGTRKAALEASLDDLLARLFGARRLDFDHDTARSYAELTRRTMAAGTLLPLADGLIAAIALAQGFAVATRDIAPFQATGVAVINLWEYRG